MKKVLQYITAYMLLILILVLGMWLFVLGREVLSGLMNTYFVGKSIARGYQAGFYDRVFLLVVGLSWLILFIVAEELLRRSTQKDGSILKVFSRFMGVECLLALALDGIMLIFLSDLSTLGWARWLVVGGELICGALFTFLGWSVRSPLYRERIIPGIIEAASSNQAESS
jgi:hypothetical protein